MQAILVVNQELWPWHIKCHRNNLKHILFVTKLQNHLYFLHLHYSWQEWRHICTQGRKVGLHTHQWELEIYYLWTSDHSSLLSKKIWDSLITDIMHNLYQLNSLKSLFLLYSCSWFELILVIKHLFTYRLRNWPN